MTSGSQFLPSSSATSSRAATSHLAASARAALGDRLWLRVALTLCFAAFSLLREGFFSGDAAAHPALRALSSTRFSGDLTALLAPFQMSPLWALIARGAEFFDVPRVLALVHIVAQFASAWAILHLGERVAGRVAGVLAALLWCGCNASSLGFAAPHDAFFTAGDVALPFALWAIALWSRARHEWGLLCALAMCADAPLGVALFLVLLGLVWWTPHPNEFAANGWRGAAFEARRRLSRCVCATCWWLLVALPLAVFLAPQLRRATALFPPQVAPDLWHGARANFAAFLRLHGEVAAPSSLSLAFPLALLLGLWCWRRAARNVPAARAVFILAMWISLLALGALLVREYSQPLAASNAAYGWRILARLAPLAVSLSLVGIAHSLERLAARQGARGLTLTIFIVLAFCILPGPSWLWLALGLLLAAWMQRSARRGSWQTSSPANARIWQHLREVFASKNRTPNVVAPWQNVAWMQRAPRFALLLLLLLAALQARTTTIRRLEKSARVLAILPDAAWLDVQRFARNKTPKSALFLSQEGGFRAFSQRAVWVERADRNLLAPFPDFARRRYVRLALAAPLWKDATPSANWLRALKKRGVTHLVINRGVRWPRVLALRKLHQNARYTIYQLR